MFVDGPAGLLTEENVAMVTVHVLGGDRHIDAIELPGLAHRELFLFDALWYFQGDIGVLLAAFLDVCRFKNRFDLTELVRSGDQALGAVIPDIVAKIYDSAFVKSYLLFEVKLGTHM